MNFYHKVYYLKEQDEWKDFEEEKKDYTGLKIGHLSISTSGEGTTGNSDGNSEAPTGTDESGNEPDKKQGPWKRLDQEPVVQIEPEKPIEQPPPQRNTGGYVPPHIRNQSSQIQPSRLKSKAAPDIHNEEFFPTLSSGKSNEPQGAWGKRYVPPHLRPPRLNINMIL